MQRMKEFKRDAQLEQNHHVIAKSLSKRSTRRYIYIYIIFLSRFLIASKAIKQYVLRISKTTRKRHYVVSSSVFTEKGPMKSRSDYHETTRAIVCMN